MATVFGTDGVRGKANQGLLSPKGGVRLGLAIAHTLRKSTGETPNLVIGRDPRRSGQMLEAAILAGVTAGGADIERLGIVPTPVTSLLTRLRSADAGIMVTASHNPAADNGIKIFGPDGAKISDQLQADLVNALASPSDAYHSAPLAIGRVVDPDGSAQEQYVDYVCRSIGDARPFDGVRLVFDGANGASAGIGPQLFRKLGADVLEIGTSPNGLNINDKVGSTAPEALCRAVLDHSADIGLAMDGDADRLLIVDEAGAVVDGDQVIAALARDMKARGVLASNRVVTTVMSNLKLEHYLETIELGLVRTPVGDRHVAAAMRRLGANLGGESSGHIILSDHVPSGDGPLSAVHALAAWRRHGGPASEAFAVFEPAAQTLINVRYGDIDPLLKDDLQKEIEATTARLEKTGRVLIRKSGTEPLIRIMVEAETKEIADREASHLARVTRELA